MKEITSCTKASAFILLTSLLILASCTLSPPKQDTPQSYGYNRSWVEHLNRIHFHQDFHLRWPLKKIQISQPYRPTRNPDHYGIDFVDRENTPIYAAHNAYVLYVGNWVRGFGNMIILQYDETWSTLYAHLNHFLVQQGETVQQGQVIALMGNTGRSTGPHLHFELRRHGRTVNPYAFFKHNLQVVSAPPATSPASVELPRIY